MRSWKFALKKIVPLIDIFDEVIFAYKVPGRCDSAFLISGWQQKGIVRSLIITMSTKNITFHGQQRMMMSVVSLVVLTLSQLVVDDLEAEIVLHCSLFVSELYLFGNLCLLLFIQLEFSITFSRQSPGAPIKFYLCQRSMRSTVVTWHSFNMAVEAGKTTTKEH